MLPTCLPAHTGEIACGPPYGLRPQRQLDSSRYLPLFEGVANMVTGLG